MNSGRERLINLIFPKRCLICDHVLGGGGVFCADCGTKVKFVADDICTGCARDKALCSCGGAKQSFDKAVSVCYYLPPVSQMLVGLKIRQNGRKTKLLAEVLKDTVEKRYAGHKFDIIVGVPSYGKKNGEFDRIGEICQHLSKKTGIRYEKNAINKIKDTNAQHLLNSRDRHKNLEGAFLSDAALVKGKNVLLIDDIITTGSTFNFCARELKNKGAKSVYCAAISATILSNR